jgi:excisionase family DNA binding protein
MDEFFAPAEVALKLKVSIRTIYRHIESGRLRSSKVGGHRITGEALRELLEDRRVPAKQVRQEARKAPPRRGRKDGLVFKFFRPTSRRESA